MADHSVSRRRFSKQPTKKLGCPVQFTVKKVLFFPSHHIPLGSSKHTKTKMVKQLKNDLMRMKSSALSSDALSSDDISSAITVVCDLEFVTKFPSSNDHFGYHHLGQAAGVTERIDPVVLGHIEDLVKSGATTHDEIDRRTADFVENELNLTRDDTYIWKRFKPDRKTIDNIKRKVLNSSMASKYDQENVMELKNKWEKKGKVRFIPKGSISQVEKLCDELVQGDADVVDQIGDFLVEEEDIGQSKLCFVYQSISMKRLYCRYACHLILLDATHKVCKYAVPLYFLVVQTNVDFQVAAIFIIEDESSDLIIQALETIKEWNPDINPKYGMTDFDDAETIALEAVFNGIILFLCDFHREQSWNRWVKTQKNNVTMISDLVMARLRRVANAFNETEC